MDYLVLENANVNELWLQFYCVFARNTLHKFQNFVRVAILIFVIETMRIFVQ